MAFPLQNRNPTAACNAESAKSFVVGEFGSVSFPAIVLAFEDHASHCDHGQYLAR